MAFQNLGALGRPLANIVEMISELYALVGGGGGDVTGKITPAAITAASTDDYDPGGGFPTNCARLDLNPSTVTSTLTGLKAGTDGQKVRVRNIGSTYSLTLDTSATSSSAANRFTGTLPAGTNPEIVPGANLDIVYNSTPSARWDVG